MLLVLQTYRFKSDTDPLLLAALYTCCEHLPSCQYLSNHELEHKKTDTLYFWDTILYYTRIYQIQAIWEKAFDKLINLSFLLSKSLQDSNPPGTRKHFLFLRLGTAHHYPSGRWAAGFFCFQDIGWEVWSGSFLGPDRWMFRVLCHMVPVLSSRPEVMEVPCV